MTKAKANDMFPPISKKFFLSIFKNILNELLDDRSPSKTTKSLSYKDSKYLSESYNKALEAFHEVFSDWMKIDRNKHYTFI